MKKRICALCLTTVLALSGCASMLNHDFVDVQPHSDHLTSEEDPTIFRAGAYSDLVKSILDMVVQGMTQGVVHLSNYTPKGESVEEDLAAACDEVRYEDPLGSYAVDYMKHDFSYIVSYYEANVYITYKRTQEQIKSLVSVTGSNAIRKELQEALTTFSTETALRVSYFNEDETYILDLARQAYYDTPAAAFGMPEVSVSIFPEPRAGRTGGYRIVELTLSYPEDADALRKKSAALKTRVMLLGGYLSSMPGPAAAAEIFQVMRDEAAYVPRSERQAGEALSTAYAALVEGRADSEGMALAVHLLCQTAGLDSQIAFGMLDGAPHVWNIVAYPGGEYRHLDATREDGLELEDIHLAQDGYSWDREEYPRCGEQPPQPQFQNVEKPGETLRSGEAKTAGSAAEADSEQAEDEKS